MTCVLRNRKYFFDRHLDVAYCGLHFMTCSFVSVSRGQAREIARKAEGRTHGA